jgi:hypothetical protein
MDFSLAACDVQCALDFQVGGLGFIANFLDMLKNGAPGTFI